MGRSTAAAAGLALALVLVAQPDGLSAQPPQQPAPAFREEVSVGWVLVPVSVRSRRGFVDDLEPREVRLFADGEPVAVGSFERGVAAPLELVVLQDLSGSMAIGGKLEASREAANCFLDRLGLGDRYALASFAGRRLSVDVPFTADIVAGREAVAGWAPYGLTALHDAVARLPEIRSSGRSAAAAVLITDGADNTSRLEPGEARAIVHRAQLPVYVLSLARRRPAGAAAAGDDYATILRRLATATGGRYLPIERTRELAAACGMVVDELRSRYVLGFPTGAGESRWRRLRIEVARRGVTIRARAGYHGPPPTAP